MKKIVSLILVLMLVFSVSAQLVSCGSNSEGGGGSSMGTSTVNVVYENSTDSYEVENGNFLTIETQVKSGYVLLGYFDSENGGEKYIGADGNSIVKWKKGFPETLYPQWKDIYEISWESEHKYTEKDYSLGQTNHGEFSFVLPEELLDAAESNPGKKIQLTIHCRAKYSSNHQSPLKIVVRQNSYNGELYGERTFSNMASEYQNFTAEIEVEAGLLTSKNLYVKIDNSSIAYWVCGYLKNIYVEAKFVQ